MNYATLPERWRDAMRRYMEHGIRPGSFLMAVLENDLMEAFSRADVDAEAELKAIVKWLYCHAPGNTYGSREKCDFHVRAARARQQAIADAAASPNPVAAGALDALEEGQ